MDDEATWGPHDPEAKAAVAAEPEPSPHRRGSTPRLALVVVLVVASVAALGLIVVTQGRGRSDRLTSEDSSKRPAPAVVLAGAAGASRAAGTAHIRTSVRRFDGGVAGKEVVEGVIGFGPPAYDLTFSYDGGGPQPFPGAPDLINEQVFSDGTTVWTELPPYMDLIPEVIAGIKATNPFKDKKYLASPVDPATGTVTPNPGLDGLSDHALGFSIGNAPADVLSYLSGVGTAVEEAKERLNGEDTVRYGAELDLDALQRALPSDQRTFDAYDFKPDVAHTFPAKVWLDRDGRLRRLTYPLDLSVLLTDVALKSDYVVEECGDPDPALVAKAMAGDREATTALASFDGKCTERPSRPEELVIEGSVEISGYGTPLSVVPPPAGEVVSSEELDAYLLSQADAALAGGLGSVVAPPPTRGTTRKAPKGP